jgi:hypothetical protein
MRLDWLKVQADLQSELRKFSQTQQNITQQDKSLAAKLAEVDRTRQYAIVGRLSASTIYDGKRLPRMYRIQAVGGPAPRTLGYLKPDEKLNIDAKLGQVVGVVGEGRVDPTLHCNIITPLRVDTLEPANLTPAPDAAPTATTPASTPPAPAPTEPTKAAANGK